MGNVRYNRLKLINKYILQEWGGKLGWVKFSFLFHSYFIICCPFLNLIYIIENQKRGFFKQMKDEEKQVEVMLVVDIIRGWQETTCNIRIKANALS